MTPKEPLCKCCRANPASTEIGLCVICAREIDVAAEMTYQLMEAQIERLNPDDQ